MYWQDAFDRFDFDDDLILHQQIHSVTNIQFYLVIHQWNGQLAVNSQAGIDQFGLEASLVGALQQSRTYSRMNADSA